MYKYTCRLDDANLVCVPASSDTTTQDEAPEEPCGLLSFVNSLQMSAERDTQILQFRLKGTGDGIIHTGGLRGVRVVEIGLCSDELVLSALANRLC